MPNTYTQIYIHIVFAVKGRQNLIPKQHKAELHGYIMGTIRKKKQTVFLHRCRPYGAKDDGGNFFSTQMPPLRGSIVMLFVFL